MPPPICEDGGAATGAGAGSSAASPSVVAAVSAVGPGAGGEFTVEFGERGPMGIDWQGPVVISAWGKAAQLGVKSGYRLVRVILGGEDILVEPGIRRLAFMKLARTKLSVRPCTLVFIMPDEQSSAAAQVLPVVSSATEAGEGMPMATAALVLPPEAAAVAELPVALPVPSGQGHSQ